MHPQKTEDNLRSLNRSDRRYKVTIVAPNCFYYHVQLFRELSASDRIDLTVYFCSDEGISGKDIKSEYGSDAIWAEEDELLGGYRYEFIRNCAPRGSYIKSMVGLANFGIWKILKNDPPDLVVVTSWMNPTWWLTFLACLRFKIPLFFMTDANFYAEEFGSKLKSWIKKKALGKLLFPNVTGFLCAGTANRLFYEYYGVTDEKLHPFVYTWGYKSLVEESGHLRTKKIELRMKFGLPEDAFVVLYCGRLSPEKGSFDLLEAFEKVNHPKKALVLVGDGELRKSMEQIIETNGIDSVYFMGFQSRKAIGQFYALADIFVLPSHKESWGIVVNEALCFSLPVIASDQVGAAVDLVSPNENGYIFPVGDVQALADCISQLVELTEEEISRMGENSLIRVNEWNDRDLATDMSGFLDLVYQS